jgi:hypothetical protein
MFEALLFQTENSTLAQTTKSLENNERSNEDERGAIEVEAVGLGFSATATTDLNGGKDVITVISPDDYPQKTAKVEKLRSLRKRTIAILVFTACAALVVLVGLAAGIKTHKNKEVASSSSALQENGADVVEVDTGSGSDSSTITSSTNSPSAVPTETVTVGVSPDGTFDPTAELNCGRDHQLVVSSKCQEGEDSNRALSFVNYCFGSTRDGDWYWIRNNDTSYDSWDYTNGASRGVVQLSTIPSGKYLVSLVRDSMEPYNVIITEELVVPDCSAAEEMVSSQARQSHGSSEAHR